MAYEIIKEEKNVEFDENHKFTLNLEQKDVYDIENIVNMVENWKESKVMAKKILDDPKGLQEELVKQALENAKPMIDAQLQQMQKLYDEASDGLKVFEPKFNEWVKKNPRKYEQLLNERKQKKPAKKEVVKK